MKICRKTLCTREKIFDLDTNLFCLHSITVRKKNMWNDLYGVRKCHFYVNFQLTLQNEWNSYFPSWVLFAWYSALQRWDAVSFTYIDELLVMWSFYSVELSISGAFNVFPSTVIVNKKPLKIWIEINDFCLKSFSQKYKSKALIQTQSDTFKFKGKAFWYIERIPKDSLKKS
jgi:hypothetical protein